MGEWIRQLFVAIFGTNSEIATIIISMVPIVELRGAIPFGAAASFWGENALSLWESFAYSVLGSSLVCVILTFLFWPIFKWLKKTRWFRKLADFIERKLSKNSENIDKKVDAEKNEKRIRWIKIAGVFAFVAIPLPLTGVWTGTCLALFLGLGKIDTLLSVLTGNIVAGLLMTLVSYFFADNTMIVLLAFLALVVVFVIYELIKGLIRKKKTAKTKTIVGEVAENKPAEEESGDAKKEKTILSQVAEENKKDDE